MLARSSALLLALALCRTVFCRHSPHTVVPEIDAVVLANVRSRLIESSQHSWELGTEAEALLEHDWPRFAVTNPRVFPLPTKLNVTTGNVSDVFSIAKKVVSQKVASSLSLIAGEGAAGDPASIGVSVLLANWTEQDKWNKTYDIAAKQQLQHLLYEVPRSPSGAISHREEQVQLWADSVYMVPPFIAFYGALQNNATLLNESYHQCAAYREVLRDDSGLWQHILLGNFQDTTHWGTGNGWAAAGMMRVLQTINASGLAPHFTREQTNLKSWINEIIASAWNYQETDGSLTNVIDNSTTFSDATGTAMLASVTYRMATFTNDTTLIPHADAAFNFVTSNIDEAGWLTNAVNPYTFNTALTPGVHSPEGQAFILIMDAARRDYLKHFNVTLSL